MADYGFGDDDKQDKPREPVAHPSTNKEWRLIEKLLVKAQDEQRAARRWNLVFRFAVLAYLIVALFVFASPQWETQSTLEPHVAVVDMSGIIAAESDASADRVVSGLRDAFESEHAVAVILRINSPGGSPVQSSYIYNEIRRLRDLHPNRPLYAVIQDMGASGGYFVASAADSIYVDPSSIVGSIGVIMNGFGFTGTMEKLGVERRVMTAGEHKAMLDPFAPVNDDEKMHVQAILDAIHEQFIDAVKQGRGERLRQEQDLFTGAFWTGSQAVELGLADGFGSAGKVARDVVGVEKTVDYSVRRTPFEQWSRRLGVAVGEGIARLLMGAQWSLQ